MPVYTEILSNEDILNLIPADCKRVFIIGCGACTNESIAFKNNVPIYNVPIGETMYPFATCMELKRIKRVLEDKNYIVKTQYFNDIDGFLCMDDINRELYHLDIEVEPDLIMCLCCPSGLTALKKKIPKIPVVCISKVKGTIAYVYKETDNSRVIVKNKSQVILFGDNHAKL